jgi:hypothetical protein
VTIDAATTADSDDDEVNREEVHHDEPGGDFRHGRKTTTRSGRRVYSPQRLIASASILTSRAQDNLSRGLRHLFELSLARVCSDQICDLEEMVATGEFSQLPEFGLVGGGFNNTEELHVLTYEQAMQSSQHREWDDAVEQEHNRMLQHGVFVPIRIEDMPTDAKKITSTWAMKLKADGTKRARLATHGFKQVQGVHNDPDTRSSPLFVMLPSG